MSPLRFPLLFAFAFLLLGCSSTPRTNPQLPPPITLAQIQEMTAKGVSDETIIASLRATQAAYHLTSAHVTWLQQAGVRPAVIDYLLSTPRLFPPPPRYYYAPAPYGWYGWHYPHFYHYY